MKKLIEQRPPLQTYSNLDYTRGLNAALNRYRRGESIINLFSKVGANGETVVLPQTTIARLILPHDKSYSGHPFEKPYAGDYLLDVLDMDMPKPWHARQLSSFVQRIRLGHTATAGETDRSTKSQDFHINDEGILFPSGGSRLWLSPDFKVGYIPVQNQDAEPPTAPNAAVLSPSPTLPPLEVGIELPVEALIA